ncbi:MAG: carboxypeptidase regulatory-like domain-containing protein [Bacteroidetes bacterium]|nr:carboxypeptidase regulatory-like domain-containing protein [Bacteroidota bacterium]
MKLAVFIVSVFTCQALFAQSYVISGKLTSPDGYPVSNARVYFQKNADYRVRTDKQGQFYITYQAGEYDSLRFEHVAYQSESYFIGKKAEKRALADTIYIRMTLSDKVLASIDIVATEKPDTLFGTQDYSVEDFEFDKNGNLVLLTYEKNMQSGSVLKLIGADDEVLDNFYIAEEAVELQTDFRNNIHLVTEEKVYLVTIQSQRFEVYLEDRDYFFRYVVPVIDTIGQNIYFSNYSDLYPAFDYFEFNRADSVYTCLLKIEDPLMMELYRSEFKYVDVRTKLWAHQKQLETGIDKEIWVGATVFTNSVYYTPLYAPLFKIGSDSILVFDHYADQMVLYRPGVGKVDSVAINYHKDARKSGWEQPLIQDEKNGKVYAMFSRAGYTYLHEINLQDGSINRSFKLYYKYVERIKIVNDEVFYVYRPFESVQKKYIYREHLPAAL